jgi:putative transposase
MTRGSQPKHDPQKHLRKSIRLRGYDYSQAGAYFVTLCTYQRECLFGVIVEGEMILNELGVVANECWRAIPEHFSHVELGAYVVMPNHMHGIIVITESVIGVQHAAPRRHQSINVIPGSLGAIVRSYKSAVTRRIGREHNISPVWQRNYYEHILRDGNNLHRITAYIESNPANWETDDDNPKNI